ncbi:CHAT domain-containing protein [Suillus occidentalis]|nr:CHAT domain-containing protein [Suillus occidentalis]
MTCGDTVTISLDASPALSVEIWASFEFGQMLGSGEVLGKFDMSWDDLLDYGDEPFDILFLPIRDVHPSLTLQASVVHAFDDQGSAQIDSIVECQIARDTNAGHAQFAKYVLSRTVSHLNEAVQHFQLVLGQCPVDHPDRAAALTNLAWARLKGYIWKDLQDIDSIISLFREALALRPQGHPDHPLSLYHLTEALNWRYSEERTAVSIHESAQLYYKLLPLCPEGTYLCGIVAGTDGVDYVIRACNKLPKDSSDEGILLRRVVLEFCPRDNNHRPKALDRLAWALLTRFNQTGNIDDLDECIKCGREAKSLCPEDHSERDSYLNNLASSLRSRFNHQGNFNDLTEAITLYEEALRLCPVGHKSRDFSLNNLATVLLIRYNQHSDIDDVTRAISLLSEALTLRLPWNTNHDHTLNNLAGALQTRYDSLHVREDLDKAIDLYWDSIRLMRLDDPERHKYLHNLSSALCSRFMQTQENGDIEVAIQLCQESLNDLHSLHPDRYFSYLRLQEAYLSRCQMQHDLVNLSLAMENFRLASRHPTQGLPSRVETALRWIDTAENYQHDSALEAYQTCLELFNNHLITRSTIISRRDAAIAFRSARTLPVNAASCAIRRNDLLRAVELLEQGRGHQWSLTSRFRTPLEDLELASPELASRLSEIHKRLSDAQGSADSTDQAAADRAVVQYRRLQERWGAVVDEIRNLKAFSRFLLSPSYEDVQAAARHGPVIIFIASRYSCSTIIIPTSGDPRHVPLPSIVLADLIVLKDRFTRAIRRASRMSPEQPRRDLIVLLRIVWDEIMLPIVNVLKGDLNLDRHSRIWLCPTAAFTSIPLHAANPFLTRADRSKEPCLEDLYVCSYTPTLSALVRSRQLMRNRVTPSFVMIGQGQPGAGKGKALLAVDSELEIVHELAPATVNRTILSGDAATRAGVLEALKENTWVHLACHGKQDHQQPYSSHFVMRDEYLTLLDIMENDIPHAEFAFLSACHTAVGDEETPDEVIHLAAGLHFSGFRSVICTLWEVDDSVAKHVVEAFYKYMFHPREEGVMDCRKAAWALNRATHVVKTRVPLEQRIVFIHIGV